MNERDLIGYGKSPPKVRWPGDARIAISVVVNYEEGSERSLLDGDPHHETNNEVPSPVPPDTRDLLNESMFEYGSRAGIWRLLRIFDKHGIPATHFCCALAIERNPEVGKEMVRRGDEVCGHGYRWEEYYAFEREEERASIIKTLDSLERTTGQRPVGWFTRYGVSVNTRDLLSEIGGFVYDSNAVNDDLPYYTTVHGKPWLVLPYSIEVNDARFWRGGLASTEDFYSYMKDSFDWSEHDAAMICKWLVESDLAYTPESAQPARLAEKAHEVDQRTLLQGWNPVSLRRRLFCPDQFFEAIQKFLGWMHAPGALVVWCITLAVGLYVIFSNWDRFAASSQGILASGNWFWLLVSGLCLKIVHELSGPRDRYSLPGMSRFQNGE